MSGSLCIWPRCFRAQPCRKWILVLPTNLTKAAGPGCTKTMPRKCVAGERKRQKSELSCWLRSLLARKPQDAPDDGCFPSDLAMYRNETAISLYRGSVSQDQHFWATIFSNIKSTTPEAYLSCASPEHFAQAMAVAHSRVIESKAANPLFSPAIFDPALSQDSNRGRDNILYLQNVVLDFENGDLLPTDIPDLFPTCNSS